uniref:THAP-type domain-containing protein n=1 Tax=Parascaris univalens TaxID=6257 RepID=A0A915BNT6_PARUN
MRYSENSIGNWKTRDDYDVVCCVQNCSVSRKMLKPDGRPYEFFSFPKNATRLARWTAIANPRFPNFQPRPIDAICEKHFRKQDLLCAKPSLMDGADPHRDESMGEEDDETDQPTRTDKKESAGFAHGKVDMCAMSGESMGTTISAKDSIPNHAVCSTIRSGHNRYDRDALDFISEDEEIDTGAESAQLCCLSEIPMMKRRAKRMEKQCDTLFLMLRTLLQSTHAEELLRRKQEEEILTAERINLTYPQITDFEARQMNALRALAEMESAKAALRIERKDSAIDLHSNRRKEQLPSASRSDDELEVLVDGKVVEQ